MRTRWDMVKARLILSGAAILDGALLAWLYAHWPLNQAGGLAIWVLVMGALAGAYATYYALPYVPQSGLFFEWLCRKRYKDVCMSVGLGRVQVHEWDNGKGGKSSVKTHHWPRLHSVAGVADNWSADITPLPGQHLKQFVDHAESFAMAFGTPFVIFERSGRAYLHMIAASKMPVPSKTDYPVLGNLPTKEHPVEESLSQVPVAVKLDGGVYSLPVEGSHVLIAGRTGAGKGSWVWSIVMSLAPAVVAGYVKLWGVDPKRIELAIGRDWWSEYADSPESAVELLETAAQGVEDRAAGLQGIARKYTASRETPLNVLVVDELGYLAALLPDKKLRERADKALQSILIKGRAVGFVVVGAIQDPRKETLGYRDLFPVRVALGLPAGMVDLVLGEDARDKGAYCDLIPIGVAGAGVGYILGETNAKPEMVRAFWCDDRVIREYGADVARSLETIGQEMLRRSAVSSVETVLQ